MSDMEAKAGSTAAPTGGTGRVGIFVIAYNAESQIKQTLSRIPEEVWKAVSVVYIIDDCSTDETVDVALAFDRWREKIVVLRNRVTRRYGGNQKLGFQYAIDHGLDYMVLLHADGKYAPENLGEMIAPLTSGEADVVVGSRMLAGKRSAAGNMPFDRYWGNRVLSRVEGAISGMPVSEFHCGYRAYKVSFLADIPFWENSDDWHFDMQVLLQAGQYGTRIKEVAVPSYYSKDIPRASGVPYALNCLLSVVFCTLHRHGIFYSRKYDVTRKGRRYFEKFADPYSSHSVILRELQKLPLKGARVLELGVGDASITKKLHEAGAIIDGLEIDDLFIGLAKPYCRSVIKCDIDQIDAAGLGSGYDIVIAADVLEHLRTPELVLSSLKKYIRKDGILMVSLPNIANLYVRLNLLFGRFPTHSKGLLDETHLHCYTLKTMAHMLTRTGWIIEMKTITAIPIAIIVPFVTKAPFRWIVHLLYGFTRVFKGLLGYQGIFVCRNPNQATLL